MGGLVLKKTAMFLGAVVSAGVLLSAPIAHAGSNCVKFEDEVFVTAANPTGPFVGPALVTIDGVQALADFIASVIPESLKLGDDGTTFATFMDTWALPDGVLAGMNQLLLDATGNPGEFRTNGRVEFTGGTGAYAGAFGHATFHGTVQLLPDGSAIGSSAVKGRICGL